ncbi:hypothetical protein VNI00_009580 [Paramarasmius palmivorus]|uniref:Uncharacterized protein n=1 Tax=Paramarasmius palmivorus TaxID=297713 RepID=A0AAW0CQ22_9AGAR
MGGFALYDDDKFRGYVWNNGTVRLRNPNDVGSAVRNEIQEYYQKFRTAAVDLNRKHCKERRRNIAEEDETCLITSTVDSQKLWKNSDLLEFLIQTGHINITEDEILGNLSHSDSITKIIAVIQTAWFLLQVGARAAEGLAITELEIITVGFAVLNFGTYFLWWNKPLRVRHPVRVHWRPQAPLVAVKNACNRDKGSAHIWDRFRELAVVLWHSIRDAVIKLGKSMIAIFNFLCLKGNPFNVYYQHDLNDESVPNMNWMTLLQLACLPLLVVFRLIAASILIIVDENDKYMAFVISPSRLEDESLTLHILAYGITTLFGAIHCIPWNFRFPTHTEQFLWRISAVGLITLPIGVAVVLSINMVIGGFVDLRKRNIEKFVEVLAISFIALLFPMAYFVARVTLMVLALMELRNLPPSAYQTVQWTTLIPHIG